MIGKITKRLPKWKEKWILMAGRVTCIKSVLTGIPLSYLSLFKIPVGV